MDMDNGNIIKIGSRVGCRRKEMHIGQKELADKIGVSQSYMSNIENGRVNVSITTFMRLCEELNVTPNYLLLGSMDSRGLEKDIADGLKMCDDKTLKLIHHIMEYMINNNSDKELY